MRPFAVASNCPNPSLCTVSSAFNISCLSISDGKGDLRHFRERLQAGIYDIVLPTSHHYFENDTPVIRDINAILDKV